MSMIQLLPGNIANLIAAGEVVQRPSSVVKELIENSLDAGATQITLVVNDSGRTLIQVIDNGSGMTPEEAELCFQRHATSKISKAEDLYNIRTYGFRGEALASVAACADVILRTRKEEDDTGTEVHIAESKVISSVPVNAHPGTNIAVRNLFYNIPARRKFLKSDNVEYRQIVSEFTRAAIPNYNVGFKFIHNSKEVFLLSPVNNVKIRISQIGNKEISKDLVDLQTDTTLVKITGYVGTPQNARKNQPNQYLFVNGRYFRSPLLHKAVLNAYSRVITEGYQPAYFIFLKIDPCNMDVNIHPTKTEIKFENDSIIFEILNAAVKEAIGGNSFVPSIDFDREGVPEIPVAPKDFKYVSPPKINFNPLFNPFKDLDNGTDDGGSPSNYYLQKNFEGGRAESSLLFMESAAEDTPFLLLRGKYILTSVKSGLMIIDIKRAVERILYTDYIEALSESKPAIQENLFPQTLDMDHGSFTLLMNEKPRLLRMGFDIRPFGDDCIVIYGLPAALKNEKLDIKECMDSLVMDLQEPENKDFDKEYKEKIALSIVKSVRYSSREYTKAEAQTILGRLFSCPDCAFSPFGLPCMKIIAMEDIAALLQKN